MNRWTSSKDPFAVWLIELAPPLGDDELLGWVNVVLEAGVEHGVYDAQKAIARRGGDLDRRDLLRDWWLSQYDREARRFPAGAQLAWHALEGGVVSGRVYDLGLLQRELHPEVDPAEHILEFRTRPPVGIVSEGPRRFAIKLCSDIWMPWVWGFVEEDWRYPHGPPYDNRDLAKRHTPRLNAFLGLVREATLAVGGTFRRAEDGEQGPLSYYAACVGEAGIVLDAKPPAPRSAR